MGSVPRWRSRTALKRSARGLWGWVPEAGVRHVGGAREAEVTLVDAQRSAANAQARGSEEVPDGAEIIDEFVHVDGLFDRAAFGKG
jgi:hypothetical protein